MEELSHVLWTYRTTPCKFIRETPFSMTYGAEAVIPLETGFPTLAPETRAEGYLVKGVPDLDEGSSASLCLSLRCQETGELFAGESVVE